MPADLESMAYFKESEVDVPWHGLGNPISFSATPEEMGDAAGLNWTVSKRPVRVPLRVPEPGQPWNFDELLKVDDFFHLVRDSDNKVLGPAGKDYIPTQNIQALNFFKNFTEAGKMRMETAGSLQGGKQIWVMAKLMYSFKLPGGDEIRGYLLLSSPHIWGKSLVIKFVTIRVVCANTFAMAMSDSKYGKGFRMPHIRAFDGDVAKEAEITLGIATELFEGFEQSANLLVEAKVDTDVVIRYIADIFQPELVTEQFGKTFYKLDEMKQAELLVDPTSPKLDPTQFKRSAFDVFNSVNRQPGAGLESTTGTMWGAFNAITYYTDHIAGRDRDNAMHSAWFGPKAVQKTEALERAKQIARVLA